MIAEIEQCEESRSLEVTSYWSGSRRIQISQGEGFITLTGHQARELAGALIGSALLAEDLRVKDVVTKLEFELS